MEPVCCSMSSSNCCFLTCIQISQETGQVVWYSHLSQNFPQFIVIHTIKGFGIINKAEIDVFLVLFCFLELSEKSFFRDVSDSWLNSANLEAVDPGGPAMFTLASSLEDPRDRGACWAAVCRVAQSQTRLKRLSSSSSSRWRQSPQELGNFDPVAIRVCLLQD